MNSLSERWPRESPIKTFSVDVRVDLTRIEAYGKFTSSKSEGDFYFDTLLNSFLALVQHPLNFVIFDAKFKPIIHFCSDKEHLEKFELFLENQDWNKKTCFSLFPEVLGGKYFICPIYMQTKQIKNRSPFVTIKPIDHNNISNRIEYISVCTQKFFSDPWDGFYTHFNEIAGNSIKLSLEALKNNQLWQVNSNSPNLSEANWPPRESVISDLMRNMDYPNTNEETWSGKDWQKVLEKIFWKAISDSKFGLMGISSLLHPKTMDEFIPLKEREPPLNMFINYRAFTQKESQKRHKNTNGCYLYDTSILIPTEDKNSFKSPYTTYLAHLKKHYARDGARKYDSDEQRCSYPRLFDEWKKEIISSELDDKELQETVNLYSDIASVIDEQFWNILKQDDGVETCLGILASPVGHHARSICDPVFSTGLIHFNPVFEFGGLDRIDTAYLKENWNSPNFDKNTKQDLLRIVIFYYLLSGMVLRNDRSGNYDPRNLGAILVPVKMRGATWAVCIHATYFDRNSDLTHEWNTIWMSTFLLTTKVRENNYDLFDKVLWSNAQRRVINLLKTFIANSSPDTFINSIEQFNKKIQSEQRVVPYALPQLSFSSEDVDDPHNKIRIKADENDYFDIYWQIKENELFVARQPWSRKGTRSFKEAIKLGIKLGLEQMETQLKN